MKKFDIMSFFIVAIGILIIFVSTDDRIEDYAVFVGALGGSLVGSGISSALDKFSSSSPVSTILDLMQRQHNASGGYATLSSQPEVIKNLGGKWYCYTASPRPETTLWRLVVYEVEVDLGTGEARFEGKFKDNDGRLVSYTYSAFARDERLVIVGNPSKQSFEPCVVQIFPHVGSQKAAENPGITFHRSWSGDNAVSMSLLSRTPIAQFSSDTKASESLSRELDMVWIDAMVRASPRLLSRLDLGAIAARNAAQR